jgi:hypothetical protein
MTLLRRQSRDRLAKASDVLYLGYVGALVSVGAFGALFAKVDARVVEGWQPAEELPPRTAATVLSQHRFLRAMELGFGVFALRDREEIHTHGPTNALFLSAMGMGIGVRGLGIAVGDGTPGPLPFAFAGYELVAIAVIFAHTRRTVRR